MIKRSKVPLSHENNLTCDMGYLVPVLTMETLPGDTFVIKTDPMVRFSPLVAPVMTDIDAHFWYFYVPNRILWDTTKDNCWETFITGGESGIAAPDKPHIIFQQTVSGSLTDYFGIATRTFGDQGIWVDALPYRAYNMIWNQWFRDQNLQEEVPISLDGGLDEVTSSQLLKKNWEKDYFTTSFPTPQRGSPVSIPLAGSAPVTGTASGSVEVGGILKGDIPVTGNGASVQWAVKDAFGFLSSPTSVTPYFGAYTADSPVGGYQDQLPSGTTLTGTGYGFPQPKSVSFKDSDSAPFARTVSSGVVTTASGRVNVPVTGTADMSNVSAINITDLRQASAIQRWLEKSMLFGSRYVEQLMSFFGIRPRDSRLAIPEYLGGFKSPVIVSEVLQTSSSTSLSPQGNMAGHAFSARLGRKIKCFSPEHGWLMCLMSVTPRTSYFQGVPRQFSRKTRNDYFWPQFQGIGEQEILNKEIYAQGIDTDNAVFGYQQRYAEYKTMPNQIHGDFRDTLLFWNMARKFSTLPVLNGDFVKSDPTTRIFADNNTGRNHLWCKINHHIKAYRPMSKYSKPQLR